MKIRVYGIFVPLFLAVLFVLNFQPTIVHAQGTAFNYQGQLISSGVPAGGTYNLTFSLFNAASGGSAVAGPVVTNGVVVTNGLFYVAIDFGAGVWNSQTNWLQIGVETNGTASFTTLAPRQEVLPVPYAIFANSASNLSGTLPATQLSGAVPLAQLPAGVVTNNESSSVTLDNLTLSGTLNLPAEVTINSGSALLLRSDNNSNFFSGLYAGNLTSSGFANTASGLEALQSNTSGSDNTANGLEALDFNTSGNGNTADGVGALYGNLSGNYNTAVGDGALGGLGLYSSGGYGNDNIALGYNAGGNFTGNESSNIDIGNGGVAGENNIIRLGTPGIQTATYLSGTVYANGVALSSDRNAKENLAAVNAQAVLDKVMALPVSEWNYISDKDAEHIGPMAQDFHAAFGLDGTDDKHISVVDEGGVALAAIQGLNERLEEENADLRKRLGELEAQVKALSEKKQ